MRVVKYLLLVVYVGVLFMTPVVGQPVTPLSVEDLLSTHSFGPLEPIQFSPDGKWLVYTIQDNRKLITYDSDQYVRSGIPTVIMGVDICLVNIETGESRNLTGGNGDNGWPSWSPDGKYLAFISDRDGSGQAKLWLWEASNGEMRKVSDLNVRLSDVLWTPNGKEILVTALPEGLTPAQYAKEIAKPENKEKEERLAAGSTAVVYRSHGTDKGTEASGQSDPWNLKSSLRDLVLVNPKDGRIKRIDHGHSINSYSLSPDGLYVSLAVAKRFEKPGSQQVLFDLNVIALETGQQRVLAKDVRLWLGGYSWSPDSSRLLYQTEGMEANGDCFAIDLKGGPPRNLTDFSSKGTAGPTPLWDEKGQRIYFVRNGALWTASLNEGKSDEIAKIPDHQIKRLINQSPGQLWSPDGGRSVLVMTENAKDKQSGFYQIDLAKGQTTKVLEKNQCYTCVNVTQKAAVSSDGKEIAYYAEDAQHDTDLWLADSNFRSVRRLTHVNPQFDKYKMGAARLIDWQTEDGEKLHGALLLPSDYQEGKRYPLIVFTYGGSNLSDRLNRFGFGSAGFANMQSFATRGYAVLEPDAPTKLGTVMKDLARTILPGVDRVIEMGIADPDRLGVMGHSFGGFTTLSLIVQTNRFKAALSADGYSDAFTIYSQMRKDGSAFATSITEGGQGKLGGTPWQFRDRYIENSPYFYLDRVETPLLLVHGGADVIVDPFLGDQTFVALRRLGKDVVYVKYEGENHSPLYWSYANQVDLCTRMIEWFDSHLKK